MIHIFIFCYNKKDAKKSKIFKKTTIIWFKIPQIWYEGLRNFLQKQFLNYFAFKC